MPRRISPAWKRGRLLGAVGMAEQQMQVICNSDLSTQKAKDIADHIRALLLDLRDALKGDT